MLPVAFSRHIASDTYVPENSRKLLKTPIYLFLWLFFISSSFSQTFLSFSLLSPVVPVVYISYMLSHLFLPFIFPVFCHVVNLFKLHIFCSHLPHRAISFYSWQSCIAEWLWSWANFKLAISSIKYILCRPRALLLLSGHNAQNNAIYLCQRNSQRVTM